MREAKGKKHKRHWRENIEALTVAIVVALLFKYFILEISKIPSGSMQPTLMGNPQTGVFDRVLVDKLSMRFRDPRRYEIVVFKHPLERSRIMVKRVVGMPGEQFKIDKGDLWTRPDAGADWTILRRPEPVQEEMWRPLDLDEPRNSSWSIVGEGRDWRLAGRSAKALGPGRIRFRADRGPIRDRYRDGYPDVLVNQIRVPAPDPGTHYVGDVRARGEIRASGETLALTIELAEGERRYVFRIPGPAAAADARPELTADLAGAAGGAPPPRVVAQAPFRLVAGESHDFAAQNLDDRLRLEIDGEEVLALDVPAADDQRALVDLSIEGGAAELDDLQVDRDIFYLPHRGAVWTHTIPEGHYVMLGDNTQDSADSRDWEAVRFELDLGDGPAWVRGNFRGDNENPTESLGADGTPVYRFRDQWGEQHWFAKGAADQDLPVPHPLVPRELVLGRAMAVFWPIKPHRSLVRLTWLH